MINNILFLFIFIIIIYSINIIRFNYKYICDIDGTKLYETNLEIKKNLLQHFNNDIQKVKKFIHLYFNKLKDSSDIESLKSLNSQENILIDSLLCNRLVKHLTKSQIENYKQYVKEMPIYKRKYKLKYYSEEVFYYHHGLRFSNKNILKYIYMKDIIDVGASFGDSLLVLQNYTKKKIHLYELSKKNINKLKINIELNKVEKEKYIIHEKGLSNFTGIITIADYGNGAVGIGKYKRNEIKVNITTLDNEFLNKNITIGFIKVDIEGQGYNFILGAKNVIKLYRPVINIGIYHNYDEYFNTRYLLEKIVDNYKYEYHQHNNCKPWACEFDLFVYPIEII